MSSALQYEAFISYSHADKALATWLHRALERFRIPRQVVASRGLDSNRFRPVFRDEEELSTSRDLPETLRAALAGSRNLIVICSPNAAGSAWVDEEVRAFAELGDPDRILCVLAAGDPAQTDACFPPTLRDATHLAIDLRPGAEKRATALLRLAASLLDVRFDDLRQRAAQDRRRRVATQALSAAALVSVAALISYRLAVEPPCRGSAERLASVWNEERRARIENAFTTTSLPYASSALARVLDRLSSYVDAWVSMHREACEATLVRNEQSERLMDLRMACLDERRDALATLVARLENADAALVESAVTEAGSLRALGRCADAAQLEAAYPLPDDPAARESIAELNLALAELDGRIAGGGLALAGEQIEALLARARQIDYPALEARALLLKSRINVFSGRTEAAKDDVYAAAAKAVLARDNQLVADAWLALPTIYARQGTGLDEASQMLELAGSYVAQLPENHPLEARFHAVRGEVLLRQGNLQEGVKDLRASVRIGRAQNLASLAPLLTRLSWGLGSLHQPEEAQGIVEEALTITLRDFGADHPLYADALKEASRVALQLGEREEALALMAQAVQIEQAAYGGSHPELAASTVRLGWAQSQAGDREAAIATLEDAIAMEEGFEQPNWTNIATAYNAIGDAEISRGNYEAARAALEAALEVWQQQEEQTLIGVALGNLGNTSNRAGRFADAESYCRRGLANDESFLPADHPDLAYPLSCLGEALLGQGQPQAALEPLGRAHDVRNRVDVDEASLAWTRWLYGRALVESGRDQTLGMSYVTFARDTFEPMGDAAASELNDVDAWLAARQQPEQ